MCIQLQNYLLFQEKVHDIVDMRFTEVGCTGHVASQGCRSRSFARLRERVPSLPTRFMCRDELSVPDSWTGGFVLPLQQSGARNGEGWEEDEIRK